MEDKRTLDEAVRRIAAGERPRDVIGLVPTLDAALETAKKIEASLRETRERAEYEGDQGTLTALTEPWGLAEMSLKPSIFTALGQAHALEGWVDTLKGEIRQLRERLGEPGSR